VRVDPGDVSVASEHGRELLDYVLGDLPRWQTEAGEITA
jgi:transcription elongation GreA/GreB family factor